MGFEAVVEEGRARLARPPGEVVVRDVADETSQVLDHHPG